MTATPTTVPVPMTAPGAPLLTPLAIASPTAAPSPTPPPTTTPGVIATTGTKPGTPAATTAATATSSPAPTIIINPPPAAAGGLLAALLSGAVIAAAMGAAITVWQARRTSHEQNRARVRATLAEAFQAYSEYKECPYAIRRRRADQPAEERLRLSEALRSVQARLSYYQAWTRIEHPPTGEAYAALLTQGRIVAGGAMRAAWNGPALDSDADMNIGPDQVDLTALSPYEQAFLDAASAHLHALHKAWRQPSNKPSTARPAGSTPTTTPTTPAPAPSSGDAETTPTDPPDTGQHA